MAPRPKATPKAGGEAVSLELERPLAAGLTPGRPLAAHFHAPEGMVLLREQSGLSGFFAGSLGAMSVEDVFAHILSGVRSGQLVVQQGSLRRAVAFRDAQAIFATSTERYERLGAVLVRLGLLTAAQLQGALARVTPQQRIGQVLTREGLLSEANLYSAMTYLVREVVLSLFEMTEGSFLFLEGPAPHGDAVKLPERMRDLVLQGSKRGEAVGRLRRRYPDEVRVAPGPEAPSADVEPLLAKVGAGIALRDLRGAYEGSTYAFLTWVDEQVRSHALAVQPAEAPPAPPRVAALTEEPPGAEERYNLLLALVARELKTAGQDVGLLRGFLDAPPPGLESAYEGVTLDEDGRVDVARIHRNVASGGEALARALTLEALDAFVSYALFSAKNVLPLEVAERLARTYRSLQEGLS
ncbi:DUF4388 domain-containing protein [Myxococcaceae bacterium GXIMD 01537]